MTTAKLLAPTPTLIEAARAALDALGSLIDAQNGPPLIGQADEWDCAMYEANAAIDALRAAIEAAEDADFLAAAVNALPSLLDEVERLRADAARLDYIEKHARYDPKMDGNHAWWPTTFEHVLRGPTLRAAIDAAIGWEKRE